MLVTSSCIYMSSAVVSIPCLPWNNQCWGRFPPLSQIIWSYPVWSPCLQKTQFPNHLSTRRVCPGWVSVWTVPVSQFCQSSTQLDTSPFHALTSEIMLGVVKSLTEAVYFAAGLIPSSVIIKLQLNLLPGKWESMLQIHSKSTVLLSLPFQLSWITIIEHQESGLPTGTLSKIPFMTSASISAFTWALKFSGTTVGVLQQYGTG